MNLNLIGTAGTYLRLKFDIMEISFATNCQFLLRKYSTSPISHTLFIWV